MKKKRRKKKLVKPTQKQKQKQSVSQVVKINIGDTKRKPIPRTRASTQKPQVIYQPQAIPIAPTIVNEEIKFKLNKLDQVLAEALMQKTSEPHQRTGNLAGAAAIRRAEGEQGSLVQTEAPILTTAFNLAPVNIMEKPEVSGGGGEPSPKRRGRPPGVKNKPKGEPAEAVATPTSSVQMKPAVGIPFVQGRVPKKRGAEESSKDIRDLMESTIQPSPKIKKDLLEEVKKIRAIQLEEDTKIRATKPLRDEVQIELKKIARTQARKMRLAELKKQKQSSV